jgi:ethanolaminephosphotransferase
MAIVPGRWATVLANVLVPLGILTFSTGFFPYKPLLPGLAIFDETDFDVSPVFDKVIFMVVDALRRYELKCIRQKPLAKHVF